MKKNLPVTQHEIDYASTKTFVTKTDIKGMITYANDSFVEVSGFSREELIGKNHNIVRHPDMPVWAFEDLWMTVKGGHPWTGIVKNRAKNGDHYWVRATVSPIIKDRVVVGYLSLRKKPDRIEISCVERL
jgi:PAS domain S-box-containing protein